MESISESGNSAEAPQSPTGPKWYVREYQEGDESALLLLYSSVFGRTRRVEQMRWKLLSRDSWPGKMVWVAVERGSERIVGHYAGIPLEFTIGGRQCLGINSVEAMAHPEFRRQGILTTLGTHAHADWAAAGYEAVIGLPNDKWGTRNAALGYVPLFPFAWLKFPLRMDRVAERQIKNRLLRSLIVVPARTISQVWRACYTSKRQGKQVDIARVDLTSQSNRAAITWSVISQQYPNAVVRSPDWLRSRYKDEPSGQYQVLASSIGTKPTGYVMYSVIDDGERVTGYLADLVLAPNDRLSARALLAAALVELDRAGAGSAMAAAPPGSAAYRHLTGCGFRRMAAGFTFEIVPLNAHIHPDVVSDPTQWHLAAGDFDIV